MKWCYLVSYGNIKNEDSEQFYSLFNDEELIEVVWINVQLIGRAGV